MSKKNVCTRKFQVLRDFFFLHPLKLVHLCIVCLFLCIYLKLCIKLTVVHTLRDRRRRHTLENHYVCLSEFFFVYSSIMPSSFRIQIAKQRPKIAYKTPAYHSCFAVSTAFSFDLFFCSAPVSFRSNRLFSTSSFALFLYLL